MTGTYQDGDWIAAQDPGAPPALLSEIAYRRWDLHPALEANPGLRPDLRQWIAQVNPPQLRQYQRSGSGVHGAGAVPHGGHAPDGYGPGAGSFAAPRRNRAGPWIAGCGCLILVFVLVVAGLGFGGLASVFSSVDRQGRPGAADRLRSAQPSAGPGLEEQLRAFDGEKTTFTQLAGTLRSNPVAPLVADTQRIGLLEQRIKAPGLSTRSAVSLVNEARQLRQELERKIAQAKVRRVNTSGSVSEGLVDSAGGGFIDIRWDAATACGKSKSSESRTLGCVKGGDPLTVHILREDAFHDGWNLRMTVVHELAHVYQRADEWSSPEGQSRADRLIARGLFQKSDEKMADCYALTYFNQWTLEHNDYRLGYGYVCNASERQAIRSWAGAIRAPLPK